MMDWNGIRDFLAVVEAGSLAGAARRLKVSQPTVSRRIAALEESLGVTLFNRTTRRLDLTGAARRILSTALSMEQTALSIERLAVGTDAALEGTVRISTTEVLGMAWLTGQMTAFRERYPGIQLEFIIDNRAVNLLRRDADIAVRLFRPQQSDLIAKKVADHAMGLYASPDYIERRGRPETIDDLTNHYAVDGDDLMRELGNQHWIKDHFGDKRVAYRSNSLAALKAAVTAGHGIGPVTCIVGDQDPALVRVLPDIVVAEHEVWLTSHPDLHSNARVRAAFDFLAELFTAHRAALMGR